jgi:hypothetical protein
MKQVPDTTAEKHLNADGTLDRASVPALVSITQSTSVIGGEWMRESVGVLV